MKRAIAIFVLFMVGPVWADVPSKCQSMIAEIGEPQYLGETPSHKILCRLGYVLSHNGEHRTPDWVIERLTPPRFKGPGDRNAQGNPFKADSDLAADERAELNDYRKSGYDRGHMAPAASMKFSEKATEESFLLSNMSPQIGPDLNRGIWADLERYTREWACARGEVIVVTGPIYAGKEKWIGDSKREDPNWVAVPQAFYKIAYDPKSRSALAFVLPNKAIKKGKRKDADVLKDYISTVSEVEQETGLHFFDALSKRDQNRIERMRSPFWPSKRCTAG